MIKIIARGSSIKGGACVGICLHDPIRIVMDEGRGEYRPLISRDMYKQCGICDNEVGRIWKALCDLGRWISDNNYQSYDPYDALDSPWAKLIPEGCVLTRRIFTQINKRSPINLRPLIGIRKKRSIKASAYLASAYTRLYQIDRQETYAQRIRDLLEYILQNRCRVYSNISWGYHFDYQTGSISYKRGDSTLVATGFIANSFIDAYEIFNKQEYLDVARSACRYVMEDLPIHREGETICISYIPHAVIAVHNANMLGVLLLSRTYKHTRDKELFRYAQKAAAYTAKYQLPSGAWYYAEDPKSHWVDGFHTGFVLDGFYHYMHATGDTTYEDKVEKCLRFYKQNLFDDLTPKSRADRLYPIDIRSASQGIQTFSIFSDYDNSYLDFALDLALWTIENMRNTDGSFQFQKCRLYTIRTPFMRWSQSTIMCALSWLLLRIHQRRRVLSND